MIPIGKFKHLGIAGVVLLVAVFGASIFFFSLHMDVVEEIDRIKKELVVLRKQAHALRDDRDLLMARIVTADSGLRITATDPSDQGAEKRLGQADADHVSGKESLNPYLAGVDSKNTREQPEKNVSKTVDPGADGDRRIYAEDFHVFYEPDTNYLKIRFFIRNTAPDQGRISGHAIVILKPNPFDPNGWLIVPTVPLISNRPTGREKGFVFSISRDMKIRLKAKNSGDPDRFTTATVFIFAQADEVLLEKDFPVNVTRRNVSDCAG